MSERYGRLEGPRWEFDEWDERYPARLRDTPAHPDRLYVLGNPDALRAQSVSIVGARKATPYGIACAELSARCAASVGVAVVSGAAMGCDQASQAEALRQGCVVSAVLGTGADVAYPRSSQGLLERIVATGGAVVYLQPWGSAPTRWSLVRRNAVIAGLSEALVICEAGMPSGTFSTAQDASDAGREILVFPGSIFSPNSTGSNYLIANNPDAIPVWDRTCLEVAYSRIFGGLRRPEAPAKGGAGCPEDLSPLDRRLLEALRASPSCPGELASSLAVDLVVLMRSLGSLEVAGRVARLRDGRYSLTESELHAQKTYDARRKP